MEDHFYYLKSLLKKKKLFLAEPALIPRVHFGFIILEAKTEEETKELIENDPSIKAEIQKTADFRPIRVLLSRK